MAQTDAELHAEFIQKMRNEQWQPQTPQAALSREQRRADLRQRLIERTGSPALADLSLAHLQSEADARARLESQLRAELAHIDGEVSAFSAETTRLMLPFEMRHQAAQVEYAAAGAALDRARSARASEFNRTLGERRNQILFKLRGVDVLQGKIIPWREANGTAPPAPVDAY